MRQLQPIITIDGPSGVGKSTIADLLAAKLDIPHLDTGAMFRYTALTLGPHGISLPPDKMLAIVDGLDFELVGEGAQARLYCNGKKLGDEIRTEQVAMLASQIAEKPEVREIMLREERKIGAKRSIIADGRDAGTVVFPNAAFKIFLKATPLARAIRRRHDLEKLGITTDLATLEKEMETRDQRDRDRPVAPLRPADDARIIDNSNISIEQVMEDIMTYIRQRETETGVTLKDGQGRSSGNSPTPPTNSGAQ